MGFRIDGSDYEIPELSSFNMGEAFLLYDKTNLTLADFALDEDDPLQAVTLRRNILHPGTVLTRMIVAYQRGNPGASVESATALIEKTNWLEAYTQYTERFARDVDPPEVTRTENATEGGVASSASSSAPSGGTSIEGLAAQDDPRTSTGTSE